MTTDAQPLSGWSRPTDPTENGDICNGVAASITVGPNTWTVQCIYSKSDDVNTNGTTYCVPSTPNPIPRVPGGPAFRVWETVGSVSAPGPVTAVSWGPLRVGRLLPDRLDLFARGSNNEVFHKFFQGDWGPNGKDGAWETIGGVSAPGPVTGVTWAPGRFDLFARGSNNEVFHKFLQGDWGPNGKDGAWETIGSVSAPGPVTAVSWAPGRLDLFARGSKNEVFHKFLQGDWGPGGKEISWEWLGFLDAPDNVAVVSWAPGRLDLFGRASNQTVQHQYFDHDWGPTKTP